MCRLLVVFFCLDLVVSGQRLLQLATRRNTSVVSPYLRHNVPAYMMKHYLMLSKQNTGKMPSQNYDTVRHINGKKLFSKLGSLKMLYDLFGLSMNEHIEEDILHVYLNHITSAARTSSYSLQVKDIFSRRIISHKPIELSSSTWHEVPLNGWSRRWSRSRRLNRGVKIIVRRRDGTIVRRDTPLIHKKPGFLPYLLLYCSTKSRLPSLYLIMRLLSYGILRKSKMLNSKPTQAELIRNPRSIKNTSCSYTIVGMTVKLHPTYGTLISPANYTTKQCIGSCNSSSRSRNNSSNCNSRIQDCCVPSVTKQFPVMYKDNSSSYIIKVIPNAIVEQCSCLSAILG